MTTTSKLNLSLNASHIHYTHLFLRRCQVQVLDTFRYAANEFYSKIFFTVYSRLLNLQYKFTVQRVNEASFFEVTTSRSCEDVNGFHNVTFGPGGKAIIYSCSVFGYDSWFQPLKAFSTFGSFPPFVGHFFKRAREPQVKLRQVVYEVSSRSKYGTFENE